MKKNLFNFLVNFLLLAGLFLIALPLAAEQFLSVKIKEAKLRSKPQHWAPAAATLRYGDQLLLIKQENGWANVSATGNRKGYVQTAAVSDKKIILSTTSASDTNADPGQIVLAGKGFSKATEEQYAKLNTATNFTAVNKLEQIKIADSEMQKFVSNGDLSVEAR